MAQLARLVGWNIFMYNVLTKAQRPNGCSIKFDFDPRIRHTEGDVGHMDVDVEDIPPTPVSTDEP